MDGRTHSRLSRVSADMKYAAPAGPAAATYSLSACAGDVRRHGVFAVHDHGERLAVVGLLEGRLTAHQHVEDDAQAPDVCKGRRQAHTQVSW